MNPNGIRSKIVLKSQKYVILADMTFPWNAQIIQ